MTGGTVPHLRAAVVDDDTVVREGLRLLLDPTGIGVVSYPDVRTLLEEQPPVDVVLLDLDLSGTGRTRVLQGRDAVAVVSRRWPVLLYTNQRRRLVLAECLAAGALGVFHKAESLEGLPAATKNVARGEVVITTALTGLAETVARRGALPELSDRQVQVLRGRARGEPFKSIASRLGISRKTAEEHMAAVSLRFAEYLRTHSAADLERHLGIGQGDLVQRGPREDR